MVENDHLNYFGITAAVVRAEVSQALAVARMHDLHIVSQLL